ncbi:S8/S53 family peptidase [Marinicella sp. W31]|uniref:S8/S53 family peptidase n=1 Tax=Marinicella sp. W31 TaxID=3023713 RepID=UPI0037574E7C
MAQETEYFFLVSRTDQKSVRLISEDNNVFTLTSSNSLLADPLIDVAQRLNASVAATKLNGFFLFNIDKKNADMLIETIPSEEINADYFEKPFKKKALSSIILFEERNQILDTQTYFTEEDAWIKFNLDFIPDTRSLVSPVNFDLYPLETRDEDDNPYGNLDWWLKCIGLDKADKLINTNQYPKITIIDDGFMPSHPAFQNIWSKKTKNKNEPIDIQNLCINGIIGYDFINQKKCPRERKHGLFTSGIICGESSNTTDLKLNSLSPGNPIEMLVGIGENANPNHLYLALLHAATKQSEIINISGGPINWTDPHLHRYLVNNPNIIITNAVGNNDKPRDFDTERTDLGYGQYDNLISVTALSQCNNLKSNANRGSMISFAVPGRYIPTTDEANNISPVGSDTSIASAIMAGILARTIRKKPHLKGDTKGLMKHLTKNNNKVKYPSKCGEYKYIKIPYLG